MEAFISILLERIILINRNKQDKWVTIAHIICPGHTPPGFIYSDLSSRDKYIKKQTGSYAQVKNYMDLLASTIIMNDDDPVIIFYSDHGGLLTGGLSYEKANPYYSSEDIYLDRHGIFFSVYPDNYCNSKFTEGYNTASLIPDILECENRNL